MHAGLYDEAERCCRESLALFRAARNRCGEARVLGILGQLAFRRNLLDDSQASCLASLDLARSLGNRWSMAVPLAILGRIALEQRQFDRARQMFTEVLSIRRERGDRRGVALTYSHLGSLEQARGDLRAALHRYGEALGVYWRLGYLDGLVQSLLAIASCLVDAGRPEDALLALAVLRRQIDASTLDKSNLDALVASASSWLSLESAAAVEEQALATRLDTIVEAYCVLHPW
jgi:tetratricopeptide (TPR) repeat protein